MYSCTFFFFLFVFSLFDCSSTEWKDERIIIQTTAAHCSSSTELIKASAVYAGRISSQYKLECEIEASAVSLTWDPSKYQSIHPSIQVQIQTPIQIVQLVTVILFVAASCMKKAGRPSSAGTSDRQRSLFIYESLNGAMPFYVPSSLKRLHHYFPCASDWLMLNVLRVKEKIGEKLLLVLHTLNKIAPMSRFKKKKEMISSYTPLFNVTVTAQAHPFYVY